ncbi:DUF6263 family protein [Sphingobacterium hungaricum]
MKKSLFTILLSLLFVNIFAQEVNFKINPEIGKPLNMVISSKMDIDGVQSMIMDMVMDMTVLPTKLENNNITFEYTTNKIKTEMNSGMMSSSYDSEQEATDDMSKMLEAEFSKIIGQKITAILTNKGNVVDLIIPEALGEGIDETLLNSLSTELPEGAKKVGESWTGEVDNDMMGTISTTSTFKEETADGYVIEVLGKIVSPDGEEIGQLSGLYTLDKKTHFTKHGVVKTSIDIQGNSIINDVTISVK